MLWSSRSPNSTARPLLNGLHQLMAPDAGVWVEGFGLRVSGVGFGFQGVGFWVWVEG